MSCWPELKGDFIVVNEKTELVLTSVGDVKRVVKVMDEKRKDCNTTKIASTMLEEVLQNIRKDDHCAIVMKELIKYVEDRYRNINNQI